MNPTVLFEGLPFDCCWVLWYLCWLWLSKRIAGLIISQNMWQVLVSDENKRKKLQYEDCSYCKVLYGTVCYVHNWVCTPSIASPRQAWIQECVFDGCSAAADDTPVRYRYNTQYQYGCSCTYFLLRQYKCHSDIFQVLTPKNKRQPSPYNKGDSGQEDVTGTLMWRTSALIGVVATPS